MIQAVHQFLVSPTGPLFLMSPCLSSSASWHLSSVQKFSINFLPLFLFYLPFIFHLFVLLYLKLILQASIELLICILEYSVLEIMTSKFEKFLVILQIFHFDGILLFFHGCNSFSNFFCKDTICFYSFTPCFISISQSLFFLYCSFCICLSS